MPAVQTPDLAPVYQSIDSEFSEESAHNRRKFVAGAAGLIGSAGLLALPAAALAKNDAKTILNIAATAEALATIVNTVGSETVALDAVTKSNVQNAAYQELTHYNVLTKGLGAKALTTKIWVPDAVFASPENLLNTLVAGDSIFVNAYLIGVTAFAKAKNATASRYSAEIMGVEAVHRALALQSLGKPGNDVIFSQYKFTKIESAVTMLQKAGFGFGKASSAPGKFYEFSDVKKRTPNTGQTTSSKPK
jgi:hypothetical protein